tara:strand:- start:46 stop:495 length:450 start_codon:yes stop_codon:yes gene_type:complete
MRVLILISTLLTVSLIYAQPIYTADDLDQSMQGVGRQFELINQLLGAGDFESAKVRVTRAREQVAPTISFWRNNEDSDAVKMLREVTEKLDMLDAELSEVTVNSDAVASVVAEVGNSLCGLLRDYVSAATVSVENRTPPSDLERIFCSD